MNPFSFILQLLYRLVPIADATTRLVQAAKASEPPAGDPVAPTGAEQYLRGRNEEAQKRYEYDRIPRVTGQSEEKVEPEEPVS